VVSKRQFHILRRVITQNTEEFSSTETVFLDHASNSVYVGLQSVVIIQDKQCRYTVTLTRVRETIVAVEKQ
jgi:hypothetical protein